MKWIVLFILLFSTNNIFAQDTLETEKVILHVYRDKDFGIINLYGKVSLNGRLRLRLSQHSYDTLTFKISDTLVISSGNSSYVVRPKNRTNLYFKLQYHPSIFIFAGRFFLIQVDEQFFHDNIKIDKFRPAKKYY